MINKPLDNRGRDNNHQDFRSDRVYRFGNGSYRPHYNRQPVIWQGQRYYSTYTYVYHPYQPRIYGSYYHPIGFFAAVLGAAAITIALNDHYYRYDHGIYYMPYNNGYQVVSAPIGAFIRYLPDGYATVNLGNYNCYYFAGTFYAASPNGYAVIDAPPGAVVYDLPAGCTELRINDIIYLRFNGTVFQPISINGQEAYEVVDLETGY